MQSLPEIEAEVTRLARILGSSDDDLPTYGRTRDSGYPHVEVDKERYHYVIVERGQEVERKSTADFENLLYWIFSGATHSLAFAYELRNRVGNQDCRRIAFSRQVELLGLISPQMAARRTTEIEEILARAPYNDGLPATPALPRH